MLMVIALHTRHCIHLISSHSSPSTTSLQATKQTVIETVEPMLDAYKPSIANAMTFKKFELGDVPRVLGK